MDLTAPAWHDHLTTPSTWEKIETSHARGLEALRLVISNMRPIPLIERIWVQESGEAWRQWGMLRINYRAPDAYNPGQLRRQRFAVTLPDLSGYYGPDDDGGSPAQWAAWLYWVLIYLAAHEVAEFFVVGGTRLFDPHTDQAWQIVHLPPPPQALHPPAWRNTAPAQHP